MAILNEEVESKYVKKAFLIKFGNLFVIPKNLKDSDLIENIMKCLNSSPFMNKIRKIEKPTKELATVRRMRVESTGPVMESLVLTHPIMAEISLPVKNQAHTTFLSSLWGESVDSSPDFGIIYNAGIYAIFREVDLSKMRYSGAPDIRDLFQSIIEGENSWRTATVSPTPLREDFF